MVIFSFRTNILRCLMSWITLGAIPLEGIEQNALMHFAFQVWQAVIISFDRNMSQPSTFRFQVLSTTNESSNVHEAAADAVCALLERMEELPTAEQGGSGGLELALFTAVRKLEEPYHMAVATEDIFKAVNLCRVFTEFAEGILLRVTSHPPAPHPHFAVAIFDSVLLCCGHPDYEVPDITFNLWYRLSEELYHRDDLVLTALFKPYVERLIVALCKHCQMEPGENSFLRDIYCDIE